MNIIYLINFQKIMLFKSILYNTDRIRSSGPSAFPVWKHSRRG